MNKTTAGIVSLLALGLLTIVGSVGAQSATPAGITEAQAKDIAQKHYTGNGKITETEVENENGTAVYAVEFTEADGNEVDVKMDAKTGKVVKVENDKTETGEEPDDR